MEVVVTAHARRRARQRLGIPGRSVKRSAWLAWTSGVLARREPNGVCVKQWRDAVWLFDDASDEVRLVTVIVPSVARDEVYAKRVCGRKPRNWRYRSRDEQLTVDW